ncbi:thiol disulfide exchange role in cytochrome c biogenesis [Paenibacillus sambharensis]|uniref:Thiol disulfide exchange role in cytochrome c biogenesis n=1 Tax=Paenibacillus sambharensis TaxID=1803190 RepID=A0A2W1LCY5_9BACL|nr:TlpA disulfide reductase family protein [Paenibacillus sambharensis]PZD96539.1 thiol disulfide exchange role in cytochrome c biogenesis [Paenibacillus sambharensis]
MNKNLAVLLASVLLAAAAVFVTTRYELSGDAAASMGAVNVPAVAGEHGALGFTLSSLEGIPVSLSDYKGKTVLLNFWVTWCKWCKQEMPHMQNVYETYSSDDFVVLAVSVGEERGKVAEFIQEHGYTFPVLLDPDKAVAQAYGVRPIPVSVFIGRDGRIAYQKLGYMDEESIASQVEALAAHTGGEEYEQH